MLRLGGFVKSVCYYFANIDLLIFRIISLHLTMQAISFWKRSPFSRLVFPLVAGILAGFYFHASFSSLIVIAIFLIIAFGIFTVINKKLNTWLIISKGIFLHLLLIWVGAALVWLHTSTHQPSYFGNAVTDSSLLLVRLNENPIPKTNSYQCEASVLSVFDNNKSTERTGKIILYFAKDEQINKLKYGDELIIKGQIQPIKNAGNPGSFNYKRFAAFQGWNYTSYLTSAQYKITGKNDAHWLKIISNDIRSYIINTLKKHLSEDDDVLAIAEALIIGYKADLDKDLVQAYSNTGIVHIIAISGMHIGMVYLLLQFIFNIIPFTKNSKRQTLPIILILWAFALLTGGSASVLRSAIMFTCIIIGKNYFKKPSSYNGLALSAFLLLCVNPFYLWDVGFQMSYLAVGGIIWLQRPIYDLWYCKNFFGDKVWSMASVTLAAQLVTFPLSLLYFHQFPTFFLIVNILVLPISAIALYAGVSLLMLSFVPILSKLIGLVLFYSLKIMNAIAAFFNEFSYSVIDGIAITWYGTLFIYVSMFLIASALISKSKPQFFIGLSALLMFFLSNSILTIQSMQQQKIIIYNTSKYTSMDIIDKNKFLFYGDTIFKQDAVFRNFHLKPSRIELQANKEVISLENCVVNNNSIFYNGTFVYVADSNSRFLPSLQKIPVDILLLTKKSPSLTQLARNFSPAVVVCNGTNSLWKTAKYRQEAEALHLRFHSTATDGAYVYNVPTK